MLVSKIYLYLNIAKKIKKLINSKILIEKSNDPRSYRQSSFKLLKTGFVPKYNVEYAIIEIIKKYSSKLV